jgi:hypothetical protein
MKFCVACRHAHAVCFGAFFGLVLGPVRSVVLGLGHPNHALLFPRQRPSNNIEKRPLPAPKQQCMCQGLPLGHAAIVTRMMDQHVMQKMQDSGLRRDRKKNHCEPRK